MTTKKLHDAALATGGLAVKALYEEQRAADFVASTDVVDSHGESIDQSSWQLGDYRANPVVLFAHDSRELPIGRTVDVGVKNGRLEAKIEFATEEMNPLAEQVWKMLRAGFLRAVSVGFLPNDGKWEVRGGADVWVWSGCVLKEISVTPVPANPEALARMKTAAPSPRTTSTRVDAKDDPPAAPGTEEKTDGAPPQKETDEMSTTNNAPQTKDTALEIAELKLEAKTAYDARDKAQDAQRAAEARVKALETEKTALEAQSKSLADARDQAVARAEKAEAGLIEAEVEALVGEKITPAEKPIFVELRKTSPDLFKKMVEQRASLKLDAPVIAGKGGENGLAKPVGDAEADAAFMDSLNKD